MQPFPVGDGSFGDVFRSFLNRENKYWSDVAFVNMDPGPDERYRVLWIRSRFKVGVLVRVWCVCVCVCVCSCVVEPTRARMPCHHIFSLREHTLQYIQQSYVTEGIPSFEALDTYEAWQAFVDDINARAPAAAANAIQTSEVRRRSGRFGVGVVLCCVVLAR